MPKLLIVTNDPCLHDSIDRAIAPSEVEVLAASTVSDGWRRIWSDRPDVVLIDLELPGELGVNLFEWIQSTDPKLPIVFVTTEGSSDVAIEAMRRGAFDYFLRPLVPKQVNLGLDRAFQAARLMRTLVLLPHVPIAGSVDRAEVMGPNVENTVRSVKWSSGWLVPIAPFR